MHPFTLGSSNSFPYGRQQRVWLDEGGRGEGEEEGAKTADPEAGGSGCGGAVEKEHMFDKVVTPSDVGKLNRLVIPKQHAEKYFPLDSSNNDKGLLLNFEDRNGKPWRFRYSYWNSSQSYVMTKGWSRFVKEKKLDAGDVVSFQRGASESARDRLFIDWRRRPDHHHHLTPVISLPHHHFSSFQRSPFHQHYPAAAAWNHHQAVFSAPLHPSSYGYGLISGGGPSGGEVVVNGNPCSGVSSSGIYLRPIVAAASQQQQMMHRGGGGAAGPAAAVVFESMPVVVHGKAAAKRLRLFGVNVDCPILDGDTSFYPSSSTSAAAASTTTTTIPSTLLQLKSSGYDDDGDDTEELHLESDDYDNNNNNKPRKSSSSASMSLDWDI
ncbi:unnamed protein product [Cuscuta campestris]|uniref:TF-B3 domain-containing protein n=1 Tax=Cuscuta campestris TaxID=132261 RepID=A0A484KCH5_9ASTE|nr:unnamed protein product [Cuscuta campestris]